MDDLVVEKLGKAVNGGENGTSGAPSQTDLLKLLASGSGGGLGGGLGGLGGLGSLAAAAQARQNGSMMRSYEALLQGPSAGRMAPQAVTLPGPTRRRKKKRRRQPDMPKKACTPFMHFCAYFKRKLMEEGKEFPQFADFGKRAGELWRNMGDEEKKKFVELSEQDRQRYIKDMKEYEERKLAEKERERELQQQREKELQVLREKELEKIQKQQREQMEQQQKQLEQHQKHQQQNPNASLMNMLNPLSPLNPLMIAAMNQTLMQTMLTNPDLMKTVYSEAARSYYIETLKNIYQNMGSSQPNGNSVPVSSSGTHGGMSDHQSHLSSSPLTSMGMNVNLLSLLNSGQLSAVPTSTPSSTGSSPLTKTPSTLKAPPSSLLGSSNSLTAAALDLSSARPSEGKGAFSSDEEMTKEADCEI
ncbi:DNA ligase 1-like isoform X1 [Penaeus japonicus]|uniref:DNA ligase 1-like isoform X1 n=1 Tax=Penaeus japonicus TaxID=27405 RepID=UPI001C711AC3|nr:DNA ligase 1-like isoform X1 [Penaeus japonicus]XP_042873072.1 DNA ligase 1-like isoform X1 [Penaeus japonicus]XP_042873073.1 DNA ligase 1-like isoform X1 [Penaeus japonicus]XP_042873074.1 DNA ligase 1-like isoform X1 [Penaeus japonicus]XP_042873075.1 DNA ligase 1-like isoform X1 [Penaeus japonicus]XP_042873076.1 DNA ligase 1-like isoform X1 [Penaeus japonicus]